MIVRAFIIAAALGALAVSAESAVRYFKVVEEPLYQQSKRIGYLPRPNQSGNFLRTRDFYFNNYSMGVDRSFDLEGKDNTLLLGDSIVLGEGYSQRARLGPVLERLTSQPVWPVAATGWSFSNELAYLEEYPEILEKTKKVIFVLNSNDFDEASTWRGEAFHPTREHTAEAPYALAKYLFPAFLDPRSAKDMDRLNSDWIFQLRGLANTYKKSFRFVIYPSKREFQDRTLYKSQWENVIGRITSVLGPSVLFLYVRDDPRWSAAMYDDDFLPTREGTKVLAEIIANGQWVLK